MTSRILIFLALLLLCHDTKADEPKTDLSTIDPPALQSDAKEKPGKQVGSAPEPAQRYLVSVAEYQVDGLVENQKTSYQLPDHLFQYFMTPDLKPLEVVRLSALSNVASHVQHGKRIKRTIATTSSGQGRGPQQVQQQHEVQIGSILEIKITALEKHSVAEVRFEVTRLFEDDDTSESSIRSTTIETTVQVEDGKPVLLGSTSEDTPRFFVLTIREMK